MRLKILLVAILVVIAGAGYLFAAPHQHAAATGNGFSQPAKSSVPSYQLSTKIGQVLAQLNASHVPVNYAMLPNFNAKTVVSGGVVEPLYATSPAPMGVGDFGLINTSSGMKGYNTSTSSVEGSLTLNSMQPFYLLNDAPQSVTVQLNTVLNNVTLFGVSNYVFWTQNVFFYSQRTHSLTFLDNIWNFSSPSFTLTANSLYNYSGNVVAPVYYYTIGPTINVSYPFTVNLYLNTTVLGQRSAVFFNYSISSPTLKHSMSGSYDRVIFNSLGAGQTALAKTQQFLISGTTLTPTGYLLYDAELMIGGPGGGSTTSIYAMSGSMHLMLLDAGTGTYNNVASAYDFGTDTGETSEGVAVAWTSSSVAYLTAGPSLLYGMWNVSAPSMGTPETLSGTIDPSNSFLFVNAGSSFNSSIAAWAPLQNDGSFSFSLPTGVYTGAALMSDYTPQESLPMSSAMSVNLVPNSAAGIYTPLYAFDNQQLANLASSGTGTVGNQYIISGSGTVVLDPLFSELNDFFFPVFPGVMFVGTSAYVQLEGFPTPYIQYMQPLVPALQFYGLPTSNYLPFEFYNSSNVSVIASPFISGWYPFFLYGFPVANLLVWNSTSVLVAGNYFSSMGSSALIYNSTNVLVWGNVFAENPIAGTSITHPSKYFMAELSSILPSSVPTGLSVFSSGDLIYNNAFMVDLPAMSPDFNIYTYGGANYMNEWNITFTLIRNASPTTFNGLTLPAESITGGAYLGGNFWYNYSPKGSLHLPFSDNGWIANGGDYVPLVSGNSNSKSYSSALQPSGA